MAEKGIVTKGLRCDCFLMLRRYEDKIGFIECKVPVPVFLQVWEKSCNPCHNAVTSSFTAGQLPIRYETGVRTRHNEPKAYPTIFIYLSTTLTGDYLSPAHSPDMVTEAP